MNIIDFVLQLIVYMYWNSNFVQKNSLIFSLKKKKKDKYYKLRSVIEKLDVMFF